MLAMRHSSCRRLKRSVNEPRRPSMSAFGPKQTWSSAPPMSAFGGKADMAFCGANVPEHGANFRMLCGWPSPVSLRPVGLVSLLDKC